MAIGAKLKQIIDSKGLKVSDLALQTGLNSQTIYSLISRDSNKVSIDALVKICNVLNVSVEELNQYDIKEKVSCTNVNISVTTHEKAVITAYRNKPEMQGAVDKLLEVRDDARHKNIDISDYTANIAAGTGAEGFTPEKLKEVDDFARQVAELERNRSE